jgi:transglutaminase/protease-like cytokinesis protein 3
MNMFLTTTFFILAGVFLGFFFNSHPSNPMKVELVSPSQQVVEQAKSELQAGGKGSKRKNASQFVSSEKRRRTVNTSQRRKQTLAKPRLSWGLKDVNSLM